MCPRESLRGEEGRFRSAVCENRPEPFPHSPAAELGQKLRRIAVGKSRGWRNPDAVFPARYFSRQNIESHLSNLANRWETSKHL